MTNDRFAMLSNLMAEYHTHFPDDALVILSGRQEQGDPESTITMVGNMSPQDMREMLRATADETDAKPEGAVFAPIQTFTKH